MKWFRWPANKKKKSQPRADNNKGSQAKSSVLMEELPDIPLGPQLDKNLQALQSVLGQQDDIIYRQIRLGIDKHTPACIIYVDGLVDSMLLDDNIIRTLMHYNPSNSKIGKSNLRDYLLESVLSTANVIEVSDVGKLVSGILSGQAIILAQGLRIALSVDIRQHAERTPSEPPAEVVVRGPREGFTETLQTNIVMVRRRIKHPQLRFQVFSIGRITATDVALVHIEGIASSDLINEVRQRLERIDVDGIIESGYLEELIEDQPFSPFPQMLHSERPDRVAAALLEGQVAVLTDNTPIALIMPAQLASFINASEDYYERYILSSSLRLLRWIAFTFSLFLPSIYIAVTTFNQEMIPPRLLTSIAAHRQGLPFSTVLEALIMEFLFEVLREAGVRLPRAIGQAISIAGALVVGQSAVMAGLVSPLMVIIVAATGIASFTIPAYNMGITIRLFRFPLMLLAGTFGLFGVSIGFIVLVTHVVNLRSFGVPFLSPLSPLHVSSLKDVLVRGPWWGMQRRPVEYDKPNPVRQAADLKPGPAQTKPKE